MKAFNKIQLIALFLLLPFLLQATEIQVKVIKDADDFPEKFCSVWKKGDFLLSDGKNLVLIGGTSRTLQSILNYPAADALGNIISFVPAGKNLQSDLIMGSPYILIKDKREYMSYSSMKPAKGKSSDGSLSFHAVALYEGEKGGKAQISTTYNFFPQIGRIDITSTIKNTGKIDFEELDYSLYLSANHSYYFSPFDYQRHPDLNFRVYQKKGHYLGLMNLNPLKDEEEEEPQPGFLAPGESFEVRYILLTDVQYDDLLRQIYQILNIKPERAIIYFEYHGGDLTEIIIRDAFSHSSFFRSFLEEPYSIEVPLPKGTYLVRANFFPAVVEEILTVGEEEENSCILQDRPLGIVKVKIRNRKGEFVPGKVTFIGLDPTKSPYFKPENPVESGRGWEYFKNSCYPQEDGLEVELPVGTYLIYASRGPEYSLDQKVVEILEGEKQEMIFQVDKAVETENLISLDPHMHTRNSDGDVYIPERIKSVVAEGVDVAVATDHNYITDYYPILKKLGLNKYLAVIKGNEVSTSGVIHFNTYPLRHIKEEENNGAIYPLSDEASTLFEASRRKNPQAILQVNHPRSERIGYFNNYQLDEETAAFARKNFDISFDVLEVMNGPYFYSSNYAAIEDWLHLLNRGYYFPILGSSDAHSIDKEEPGYSRTYVFYKGEKSDNLDWPALAQAIKKGQSFVSNGPLVEFKINDKYTSGDTITVKEGEIDIWLKVQSAPWITVDEVRLIVNGERKIVFPVKIQEKSILKFLEEIGLKLKKDSYILVEVLGKKSLFPVLQRPARDGLLEKATLPYALTNPVFIDVDGNGRFDPPLPEKIRLTSHIPEPKNIIERY